MFTLSRAFKDLQWWELSIHQISQSNLCEENVADNEVNMAVLDLWWNHLASKNTYTAKTDW